MALFHATSYDKCDLYHLFDFTCFLDPPLSHTLSCADPEGFVRAGPFLTTFFFLVYEGREDPNTTISGPLSARQRNAI